MDLMISRNDPNFFPVSFRYGGVSSSELLPRWERSFSESEGPGYPVTTLSYRDPETGLTVSLVCRRYDGGQTLDWTLYFEQTGGENSRILSDVWALDQAYPVTGMSQPGEVRLDGMIFAPLATFNPGEESLPVLNRMRGSIGCAYFTMREFEPMSDTLRDGKPVAFQGQSSHDAYSPYFDVVWPRGGIVTAVGWTGQWTAEVCCDAASSSVQLKAAMPGLRAYLKPGERIRTPRIMQTVYEGDDPETGYNLFRRALIRYVSPQREGGPCFQPLCASCPDENATTQDIELDWIDNVMDGLPFEVYWHDAWWHVGGFPAGKGNYTYPLETAVDPVRYSRGMRQLGDEAHAKGFRFLLWFAPECVPAGSTLFKEHPEFLLMAPNRSFGTLNLGDPAARKYMTGYLIDCIRAWDIDIFRTDDGFDISLINGSDEPDRQGIAQIRYMEGLYQMWDDIIACKEGMIVDNCSGGGTRLDLETTSRSICIWRTDSSNWARAWWDERCAVLNQAINCSLNRYTFATNSGTIYMDPYYIRSGFNGGLSLFDDLRKYKDRREELKKALQECLRIRKYYAGDFYRLIYQGTDPREWCAWQYHLPETGEGVALAFRRSRSPYSQATLALKGLAPGRRYSVDFYGESYDLKEMKVLTGAELAALAVTLPGPCTSALIEYRPVN